MRRLEDDARAVPPFRILGANGTTYLPPSPPSSAVGEPYRLATPSSTSGRAHRRSSFVIIAEARPETPTSRSPSLSLASGRVSPFRGRGFKGPPPHAQSRPQTPEKNEKRPSRLDRRISTSQQNSPKHSLKPQTTRRRSVSLTKPETGRTSPKYGRRAAVRNNLEVKTAVTERKASLKVPGLSPIHGTPTKPPDKKNGLPVPDQHSNVALKRPALLKSRRNSSQLPPKGVSPMKPASKPTKTRKDSTERLLSPSRIPVKQGSVSSKVSTVNQRRGSLNKPPTKPSGGQHTEKSTEHNATADKKSGENKTAASEASTGSKSNQKSNSPASATTEDVPRDKAGSSDPKDHPDKEPNLIDLLKQTSRASGTSSVVNTTTVTAVQPLQIDAAALLERDVARMEKDNKETRRNLSSARRGNQADAPSMTPGSHGRSQAAQNGAQKSGHNSHSTSKSGVPSPAPDTGARDQKTPGSSRVEDSAGGENHQDRATISTQETKTVDGNQHRGLGNNNSNGTVHDGNNRTGNSNSNTPVNNQTAVVHPLGARQSGLAKNQTGNQQRPENNSRQEVTTDEGGRGTDSPSETQRVRETAVGARNDVQNPDGRTKRHFDGRHAENNMSIQPDTKNSTTHFVTTPVTSVKSANAHHNVSNGTQQANKLGSDVSLKSSGGISTGSTDTGVSVNTVRGVSSAREKRGMHMVKKSETIETLSGNVMHLEQNGEPTLLATIPSNQRDVEDENSTPANTSRWKRFVHSCCGCCCCLQDRQPGMKCPVCRRGVKPSVSQWATRQELSQKPADRLDKQKLKDRCCRLPSWKGCCRLPSWKCCSRESRVAPVEESSCCPPERRCNALCRRIFGRCACKHKEPPRVRNVEAKQSLTSIVPPALPEEPKVKLPDVLVEHNALMRGAIPCLPIPLAWFCLIWNVFLPGSGTVWSGLFNLCTGQPRFSAVAGPRARIGAFLVNAIVGMGQLFTVLFCLVGWGWSIWWGVIMVRLARKYKRFRDSEAATNDVEARRGAESSNLPPGVPNQVLRGFERAR